MKAGLKESSSEACAAQEPEWARSFLRTGGDDSRPKHLGGRPKLQFNKDGARILAPALDPAAAVDILKPYGIHRHIIQHCARSR